VKPREIYLREGGTLSFDPPPASAAGSDAYLSDPAHPIPYVPRPDDGEGWRTWLERDQRFVDNRPDVLTWKSAPLTEDLVIAGDVVAHLFASTTGSDADWVVKLIDVYPEDVPDRPEMGGYELMVNADIMRGRYWKSFSQPAPIPANTVTPFTVDLHEQLYRFRKGHRLMVQVQSTWFPLYDRNPQTFVPNIFLAKPGDYQAATHRVWHTPQYPSRVSVMVLPQ
jgi:putative CocE/NonD family hydrolase